MKVRFIGDVHGKYSRYKRIIKGCEYSIQVGDMGVGFRHTQGPATGELRGNPPFYAMYPKHRFIRGNHDNPHECKKHKCWIEDGAVLKLGEHKVMFVGGAKSTDIPYRQQGYTWWVEEELSWKELDFIVERYCLTKPDIMVTHDCPQIIAATLNCTLTMAETDTRKALERMWQLHEPKYWFFGHWHKSWGQAARGTYFRCLAELEYYDMEL